MGHHGLHNLLTVLTGFEGGSTMRIPPFVKDNWLVLSVFGASALAVIWFGASFLLNVIYFNDPRHQDEALKPWMTPRYVVMSYDLPRGVVADVLDLPEGGHKGLQMDAIAAGMGLTLEELTALVRETAAAHREVSQ